MRALTSAFVMLAVALAASVAAGPEKGKPPGKSIKGRFTIVAGEKDGEKVPDDHIKGSLVVFTENTITGHDKDRKEFFGAKYTLDTSKTPWRISMVSTAPKKDEKAEGIVAWDGDDLKLCYALPGGKTPTCFSAKEKQQCFVLRRIKE